MHFSDENASPIVSTLRPETIQHATYVGRILELRRPTHARVPVCHSRDSTMQAPAYARRSHGAGRWDVLSAGVLSVLAGTLMHAQDIGRPMSQPIEEIVV